MRWFRRFPPEDFPVCARRARLSMKMCRSRNLCRKKLLKSIRHARFTMKSKRVSRNENSGGQEFMKKGLVIKIFSFILLGVLAFAASGQTDSKSKKNLPTLFIIGDSTVNNSGEGFQGWGNVIGDLFDKTKINVENRARGGRSSRTFYTEGLWEKVLSELKPGDFVL